MPCSKIDTYASIDALPQSAQHLLLSAQAGDFQAGPVWFRVLASTALLDADLPLWLASLRGDSCRLVWPLVRPHGARGELRSLANFYTTRYIPALHSTTEVEDVRRAAESLRSGSTRAWRVELAPLERDAATFGMLRKGLEQAGYRVFEYFCFGNLYESLAPDETAEQYLSRRPGRVRTTLHRMSRRFAKADGTIELVLPDGDVQRATRAFERVYAASWKRPEPFPRFMPEFIAACAREGWLRMAIAWQGGEAIAAQVWVVANGKASIFKLAYDESRSEHSPGTLLTAALCRHVIDVDRVREIDYLTGDDPYKRDWMSSRRELWGLLALDPRRIRGAAMVLRETIARALRALGRTLGR